jgi:ketosteroid isomerase-like protein
MKAWICVLLSTMILSATAPEPKVEKEVLAAMGAWKQAMLRKDGAALEKLLHPDITYSHSSGAVQTKAEVIKSATAEKATTQAIEFADTNVRVYGKTALVRGVVDLTSGTGKTHLNILTVWLKGPQGWQMVARQATKLP